MPLFDRWFWPDFVGIGAHRAGSTWLWSNLRRHPDIYMPGTKELHHFDYHDRRQVLPFSKEGDRLLRYGARFLPGKIQGRTSGEITPAYSTLPINQVRRIRDRFPDLRVIFVMRNPVDRAWSHAKQSVPPIYEKPLEDVTREELREFFDLPFVVNRGDYQRVLENWGTVFPDDRLFVGILEEMSSRPAEVFPELLGFLKVDPDWDVDWDTVHRPVNETSEVDMPQWVRKFLVDRYRPHVESVTKYLEREPPWDLQT